ncbi:SET domain containing (Lysine methyltransferase) 7, partial [Caligus rogercresseyi]
GRNRDPLSDNNWKALIDKRKKCKARMQNLKEELDTATKALIDIDKRRRENGHLYDPPPSRFLSSASFRHPTRSPSSNLPAQRVQRTPHLNLNFERHSFIRDTVYKRAPNDICPFKLPISEVDPKRREVLSFHNAHCVQDPPISWESNEQYSHSTKNSVSAEIKMAEPKDYLRILVHTSWESLQTFNGLFQLSNALIKKEDSYLLTILYQLTQVFFCIHQKKVSNDLGAKAIYETHSSQEEVISFDSISSQVHFEIVDDSGIDEEDWEYYSENEGERAKSPQRGQAFPRIPASLLERWNTSIWASDEDSSESDYYSSENEEETEYYEEFEFTDDRLLKWIRNLNNSEETKFLKTLTASRINPLKFRKTTKGKNVTEYVYDQDGHTSGFFREFINGQFNSFGKCETIVIPERKPTLKKDKILWLKLKGNTYCFYGQHQSVYLYPDLTTAIVGEYSSSGQLLGHGTYGKVTSIRAEEELIIPVVTPMEGLQRIIHDPASSIVISKNPLLRDPYETLTVKVSQSTIPFAGDGLFARRSVGPLTLLALFNGVKIREATAHRGQWSLQTTEYRIALKRDMSLDIPAGNASLSKYCASLGHKCCHSFRPNSFFEEIVHPRFGHIMSLISQKSIRIGEEITVSYNYDLARAPPWYRDAWFVHLREAQGLSEEELQDLANKKSQAWGIFVEVPSPPRGSDRFRPCGSCDEHLGLRQWTLSCTICELWFHFSCIKEISEEEFEEASRSEEGLDWRCRECAGLKS